MDVGCQTCGQMNPAGAAECQYCGALLPATPLSERPTRSWRLQAVNAQSWGGQGSTQRRQGLKDPNLGLLLELLPGLFFFLGIGRMWAGEVALGIFLMLGYWFAGIVLTFTTAIASALDICIFPICLLYWPGVPIASAILLQRRLQRERQQLVNASAVHPY